MKLFKKLFCFFLIFSFSLFMVVNVSAASDLFTPIDTSIPGYNYDYVLNGFGRKNVVISESDEYGCFYDGCYGVLQDVGSLDRYTDDYHFYAKTLYWKPEYPIGFSSAGFKSNLHAVFNMYSNDYFSSLDFYFIVNIYGLDPIDQRLTASVSISNVVHSALYDSSDPYSIDLRTTLVARSDHALPGYISNFYVWHASYHSDDVFFDLIDSEFSEMIITVNVPDYIGTFVSDISYIEFGILAARIGPEGFFYTPPLDSPYDIWAGIGVLPSVKYPSSVTGSITPTFIISSISDLDLITILLVPLATVAFGFFTFRLILWK